MTLRVSALFACILLFACPPGTTGGPGGPTPTPDECAEDNDGDGAPKWGADGIDGNEDDDCNDANEDTYPGADELCDGFDNDCDGAVSQAELDHSGDGLADCAYVDCDSMGMTWRHEQHYPEFTADRVHCGECNRLIGDSVCRQTRPLLCINVDGSPNPGLAVTSGEQWASGSIQLTDPIWGCQLTSAQIGDDICAGTFGVDWRMARWGDGDGWGFQAYGDITGEGFNGRFFVNQTEQPANCWDQ